MKYQLTFCTHLYIQLDSYDRIWSIRQNDDEASNNEANVSIDYLGSNHTCQVNVSEGYQEEFRWNFYQGSDDETMQDVETKLPEAGFEFIDEDLTYDHPNIDEANWSYQGDVYDDMYSGVVEEVDGS